MSETNPSTHQRSTAWIGVGGIVSGARILATGCEGGIIGAGVTYGIGIGAGIEVASDGASWLLSCAAGAVYNSAVSFIHWLGW